MATSTGHLTIEDFERLPQEQAENHELVDGELVEISGNTLKRNYLRDFLIIRLHAVVLGGRLGRVVAEQ